MGRGSWMTKSYPGRRRGQGLLGGRCEGMVGTQSQRTEMPTSSPHLPEVRGAPLALEAQEPRIQREMVSPHPSILQWPSLLTWPRVQLGAAKPEENRTAQHVVSQKKAENRAETPSNSLTCTMLKRKKPHILPGNAVKTSRLPDFLK